MQVHTLVQGSPEWHAHRREHFNASDAPAMLGCSQYKTRAELVRELATGLSADNSDRQHLFDAGHRAERKARAIAEDIAGEDMLPMVGSVGKLSASFDGLTFDRKLLWEHKLLNDALRKALPGDGLAGIVSNPSRLPKQYCVQLEQQLMVSGARAALFMATSWSGDECTDMRCCFYNSDPALRQEIITGWEQLAIDVANYVPEKAAEAVMATPVDSLPAIFVRADGRVEVKSNLPDFREKLVAYIKGLPTKPSTDQEFADAEAGVKRLKQAREVCLAKADELLSPFADAESAIRALKDAAQLCSDTYNALDKAVKARKDEIRSEIVAEYAGKLAAHVAAVDPLGPNGETLLKVVGDFAGAIKGKRTVESLRNAAEHELSVCRAKADSMAARIAENKAAVTRADAWHLMRDFREICDTSAVAFEAVLSMRVSEERIRQERLAAEDAAREKAAMAEKQDAEVRAPAAAAPTTGGHEFAPFRGYDLAKQAPAQDRVSRFVEHYCSQHGKGAAGVARHVTVSFLEFLANDGVHLDEAAEV